jgi:hypothetical protein
MCSCGSAVVLVQGLPATATNRTQLCRANGRGEVLHHVMCSFCFILPVLHGIGGRWCTEEKNHESIRIVGIWLSEYHSGIHGTRTGSFGYGALIDCLIWEINWDLIPSARHIELFVGASCLRQLELCWFDWLSDCFTRNNADPIEVFVTSFCVTSLRVTK